MNFGGTLVIRNMLKIALAILASLVKFQDCLHCLEARTDFVFLLATNTRQLWLVFTFFSKKIQLTQNSGHGFASSSSSLCGSGGMFSDISMVSFFFPCSQPFVIPVHFWQVPACVQQHQAMCCFNHNRFFGFNIFASNTDQKCNCCLLTVQRSDAILVGLFTVPTRVCVIKVACSVFLCNYRLCAHAMHYHRLDNIHFLNSNWWDIIVTCSFKMTSRGNHTTHHWSAVDQTKI